MAIVDNYNCRTYEKKTNQKCVQARDDETYNYYDQKLILDVKVI